MTDRLQQLEREQVNIQELMRALDRVILSYEPDYQASALTGPEHTVCPSGLLKSAHDSWRAARMMTDRVSLRFGRYASVREVTDRIVSVHFFGSEGVGRIGIGHEAETNDLHHNAYEGTQI